MAYPASLDVMPSWADGASRTDTSGPALLTAADMTALSSAIVALQATLGLNPQGSFATVAARLADVAAQLASLAAGLAAAAPLASPALTGNPTAPTQAPGNNSTRIATTAFVEARVSTIRGGTA